MFKIIEFKHINSTSDYLKQNVKVLSPFTIVKAEYQTNGRGQFDRTWQSNAGENLLFSILLKNMDYQKMELIKNWILTSLIELLKLYHIKAIFKEPNDLLVNGKKICGILIETRNNLSKFEYVIIGIGLNINQSMFTSIEATSISIEGERVFDIDGVFSNALTLLEARIKHVITD